jgi:hypothetical protein
VRVDSRDPHLQLIIPAHNALDDEVVAPSVLVQVVVVPRDPGASRSAIGPGAAAARVDKQLCEAAQLFLVRGGSELGVRDTALVPRN